jgi:leucyl/phenylalanyl-tRNA--protein transferase
LPVFALDKELFFPPPELAEADGLLAIGGDLSAERLIKAYREGIFPWYEGEHILWWSPDPRFVLFPGEIKISRSMQALLKKDRFSFTMNKAFDQVISQCKTVNRPGQFGTWITDEVEEAYTRLHHSGYAVSAEAWSGNGLVGGLYGLLIGKLFCGESMFSKQSNASKFAFIKLVEQLKKQGVELIDCQVYTEHLESLGARMISREKFIAAVKMLT